MTIHDEQADGEPVQGQSAVTPTPSVSYTGEGSPRKRKQEQRAANEAAVDAAVHAAASAYQPASFGTYSGTSYYQ